MDYLTNEERKRVLYSDEKLFPHRAQTPIEKEMTCLIDLYNDPTFVGRDAQMAASLDRLSVLTAGPFLSDKFRKAMGTPEVFDQFTEKYPYAKYYTLISNSVSKSAEQFYPLETLAKANFTKNDVRKVIRWVSQVAGLISDLPKGHDVFVYTRATGSYDLKSRAKLKDDKAFYGITLPKVTQDRVHELFGNNRVGDYFPGCPDWLMTWARNSGIYKHPEMWGRFDMADIANEFIASGVELSFDFDMTHFPMGSSVTIPYLELKHPSSNSRFRFIVQD